MLELQDAGHAAATRPRGEAAHSNLCVPADPVSTMEGIDNCHPMILPGTAPATLADGGGAEQQPQQAESGTAGMAAAATAAGAVAPTGSSPILVQEQQLKVPPGSLKHNLVPQVRPSSTEQWQPDLSEAPPAKRMKATGTGLWESMVQQFAPWNNHLGRGL